MEVVGGGVPRAALVEARTEQGAAVDEVLALRASPDQSSVTSQSSVPISSADPGTWLLTAVRCHR